MGEVINKEYLTRDDLLRVREEIDHVLAMFEIVGKRIEGVVELLDIQSQQIERLEGKAMSHANLISSLMADNATTSEDHHERISKLESDANMRPV